MKILIDIDDTISNFCEVLLRWLNLINNTNYKKEDVDNWEWLRQKFINPWFPTEFEEFWDEIKIDKDAIECIENLSKQGNEVYLITASFPNDMLGYKIRKTLSNFNQDLINEKNVIICYNKGLIKGDIRIDDGIHNLYNDGSLNILYSQPWNQNFENKIENPEIIKKDNWKDVADLIETYDIVVNKK